MGEFEKYRLNDYAHWELFAHKEQYPYIGRCYAWAKRSDLARICDMNSIEREELFEIVIPEWESVVDKLFQHDWSNVASFGNTTPHLHWHLIPRYHRELEILDVKFKDSNPTGNYAPYPRGVLNDAQTEKIVTMVRDGFKQLNDD